MPKTFFPVSILTALLGQLGPTDGSNKDFL